MLDFTLAIQQIFEDDWLSTLKGDALATSYRGPWKLVYYEAYLEQADALGREKYLKSGGGRKLLKNQLRNYLTKSA